MSVFYSISAIPLGTCENSVRFWLGAPADQTVQYGPKDWAK